MQEAPKAQVKTAKKSRTAGVEKSKGCEESREGPESSNMQFEVPVDELISRFTQATNELQLMGIVKAAPRKKIGQYAQRLVFGSGA